jgi:hypothetical protein
MRLSMVLPWAATDDDGFAMIRQNATVKSIAKRTKLDLFIYLSLYWLKMNLS